jgi:histidine triad (HIT) family protein
MHVVPRYEDDPLKLPWIPRGADAAQIAAVAAEIRGEG